MVVSVLVALYRQYAQACRLAVGLEQIVDPRHEQSAVLSNYVGAQHHLFLAGLGMLVLLVVPVPVDR